MPGPSAIRYINQDDWPDETPGGVGPTPSPLHSSNYVVSNWSILLCLILPLTYWLLF